MFEPCKYRIVKRNEGLIRKHSMNFIEYSASVLPAIAICVAHICLLLHVMHYGLPDQSATKHFHCTLLMWLVFIYFVRCSIKTSSCFLRVAFLFFNMREWVSVRFISLCRVAVLSTQLPSLSISSVPRFATNRAKTCVRSLPGGTTY